MSRTALRRGFGRRGFLIMGIAVILAMTVVVASQAPTAGAVSSCTDSYTGASGGDWGTASNWTTNSSTHAVPTASDVACIPSGTTVDVEESGDAAALIQGTPTATSVGSLDVTGDGSALTLGATDTTDTSQIAGLTLANDGKLTIDDALADSGSFSMTTATLDGPATGTGTLTVGGNFLVTSVNGQGSSSIGPDLSITQNGSGTFAMGSSGDEETVIASPIVTNTTDSAPDAVYVDGTITGGGGTSTVTSTNQPITLQAGTNVWQGGGSTVTLTAPGFVTTGATTMGAQALVIDGSKSSLSGLLTIEGGGLTLDPGDTLSTGTSGDGLDFDGGSSSLQGTIDGTGTFETTSYATVTIASGATFTVPTISASGPSTINDDLANTITLTDLTLTGGRLYLNSTGGITDTGNLSIMDGTLDGPASGTDNVTVAGNFDNTSDGQGTSSIGTDLSITQNGSGTFAIGDNPNDGHGAPQGEFIASPILTNTTSAVMVYGTITGGGGTPTVTSTNEPITLASTTWQGGGITVTLTAPGFITTASTTMGAQDLVVAGANRSTVVGTLTTGTGLNVGVGDQFTTGASASDGLDIAGNATLSGTLSGSGPVWVSNGTTNLSGTVSVPSIAVSSYGNLNDNVTNLDLDGLTLGYTASTLEYGGHLSIGAGDTIDDSGNFSMDTATLDGPATGTGTLIVGGNFLVTSVNGEGTSTIGTNLSITQNGSGTFAMGSSGDEETVIASPIVTNTTDSAPDAVYVDGTITGGGGTSTVTSTNAPMTLQSGAGVWQGGGGMVTLDGDGFVFTANTEMGAQQLVQIGGTTDLPSGTTVTEGNGYTLQSGTLQVDGTLSGNVTVTGGTLTGTGLVDGNVTNTSGTVSPGDGTPGTLTVGDDYSQGASGSLAIEIDSLTSYSVLAIDSNVTALGGTLELEPSAAYAASADPGDEFGVMTYNNEPPSSHEFTTVDSTQMLPDGESWIAEPIDADEYIAEVGQRGTPGNTTLPLISGGTTEGDQLSTTNGSWTNGPTQFSYQWEDCTTAAATTCTAINGATSSEYTSTASDLGSYVTVVVTAGEPDSGNSAQVKAVAVGPITAPVVQQAPPPAAPTSTAPPSVSGSPLPGNTLTCNPGTWTGDPTFTYQWNRGTAAITGATSQTYTVQILDEGLTVTCTVTATNAGGSQTATSAGSIVAQPGTLTCPKPSGTLTSTRVGPVALGETRKSARHSLSHYTVPNKSLDNFCLYGGWGIRVGYIDNKIVLALSANPYYSLDGATDGDQLSAFAKKLKVGKIMVIGLNDWYLVKGPGATDYVLKVRHNIIQGVGIAYKKYMTTRKSEEHFLASFVIE